MKALGDGSLRSPGYGAPELRRYYQKSMSRSLMLSIVLQAACIATYYAFRSPEAQIEPPRRAEIFPYPYPLPPSLLQTKNSSSIVTGVKSLLHWKNAIPVPVTDPFIDSDSLVAPHPQFGEETDGLGDGTLSGTSVGGLLTMENDAKEPPPFRPVQKGPQAVKRVEPKYPAIAVRAGIEGTVVLNLWVDRTGRVRKAVVLKSKGTILDTSAEDAAMQWVFTPAIMQQSPVSVWVSIPFRFKIDRK